MEDGSLRRIVIVGGGTAGWMTAAALSRFCVPRFEVVLVESDEIGTIGVGEATIPSIMQFNEALGINEAEFLSATGATYKLGIAFEGWGKPDEGYVHAFGLVGAALGVVPFHHYWLRGRKLGIAKPLGHYVLHTLAIAANRFAHITPPAGSPLPPLPYAFHFDASLYAKFLRGFAEGRGIVRQEGRIVAVERNQQNGDIGAVVLANGSRVEGDLFIDCSGFRGLLIEQELEAGFEDWTHWLQCDRAVAVPCARVDPLVPLTRSIARKAGWQWRIPLQHRIGNGHVFNSDHISEDEATAILLANLDGEAMADPRPVRFRPGRRLKAWDKNVIALGLSSGFLEPLESTSIHLIQTGIHRLLAIFPSAGFDQADIDEYNRQSQFEYEDVRDFIIAHYKVTRRSGDPFWDHVRAMDVPDSLTERLELFRSSGRFFKHGAAELFAEESWVQVLLGQGFAMTPDPVTRFVETEELVGFLNDLAEVIDDVSDKMPDHGEFVARLPASSAPQQAAQPPSVNFAIKYERITH